MSTYYYYFSGRDSDDYDQVQALGRYIGVKRGSDIIADAIIYHDNCWWKVLGNGTTVESEILYAEKAGGLDAGAEEVKIPIDERALYPAVLEGAPLQFQDGVLLGEPWPDFGLIYVKDARSRGVGSDPDEKVFGIFSRQYDLEGAPYYAPVDPEMQPGVASVWILWPGQDLILDWEPVGVADLLREYSGESRA